ncbi:MAG: hypothetical protein ACRDHZ_25555 [Ktedonobacteraceae bacterium]
MYVDSSSPEEAARRTFLTQVEMWLAACTPQWRHDPQVVTLTLASLIGGYVVT